MSSSKKGESNGRALLSLSVLQKHHRRVGPDAARLELAAFGKAFPVLELDVVARVASFGGGPPQFANPVRLGAVNALPSLLRLAELADPASREFVERHGDVGELELAQSVLHVGAERAALDAGVLTLDALMPPCLDVFFIVAEASTPRQDSGHAPPPLPLSQRTAVVFSRRFP